MKKYQMEDLLFHELGYEGYLERLKNMKEELKKRFRQKLPKEKWRNIARKIGNSEKYLRGDLI